MMNQRPGQSTSGVAWIARLRQARRAPSAKPRLDLDPQSAYELLTRQMVSSLSEELREIRLRVNGLLFVTITAVLTDVVIRLTH